MLLLSTVEMVLYSTLKSITVITQKMLKAVPNFQQSKVLPNIRATSLIDISRKYE